MARCRECREAIIKRMVTKTAAMDLLPILSIFRNPRNLFNPRKSAIKKYGPENQPGAGKSRFFFWQPLTNKKSCVPLHH
jgi:hypothetical protein